MPKYRIVQVAPTSQPKCFRVDEYSSQLVSFVYSGMDNHFKTAKDDRGWAFFNSLELAEKFIQNRLIQEANDAQSIMVHTIIKVYD
jgi:hypothetical protein